MASINDIPFGIGGRETFALMTFSGRCAICTESLLQNVVQFSFLLTHFHTQLEYHNVHSCNIELAARVKLHCKEQQKTGCFSLMTTN